MTKHILSKHTPFDTLQIVSGMFHHALCIDVNFGRFLVGWIFEVFPIHLDHNVVDLSILIDWILWYNVIFSPLLLESNSIFIPILLGYHLFDNFTFKLLRANSYLNNLHICFSFYFHIVCNSFVYAYTIYLWKAIETILPSHFNIIHITCLWNNHPH